VGRRRGADSSPLRELADALDPECFVQVHRSAIVNLVHVDRFSHGRATPAKFI
jgi:DNA-binding LytR/AlgR family response regulator